jgi:hypothetical protein
MSELGPDGIRIVLSDDGVPVDLGDPDDPRAVLHRTVVELMRGIDGRADITTGPGTVVTLSWGSVVVTGTAPRPEPAEVSA